MKTKYKDKSGAFVQVDGVDGGYTIERIWTPEEHREHGIMRGLMESVIDDANKEGVTLFAMLSPDDRADDDLLEDFFSRMGFVSLVMDGEVYRMDKVKEPEIEDIA